MRTFHHIDQRSPLWHLLRIGKVTSSNMHRVVASGKGAETYYDEIMAQIYLLNAVHDGHCDYDEAFDQFGYQSRAMLVGRDFEALAISEWCERTGHEVESIGFIEFERYPIGASTDGMVVGKEEIMEVKVPNSAKHLGTLRSGSMPREHIIQVQSELWISGKEACNFLSFDHRQALPEKNLFWQRVERDESKIQEIMDKAIPFAERLPKNPFDFDLRDIVVGSDDVELNWGR